MGWRVATHYPPPFSCGRTVKLFCKKCDGWKSENDFYPYAKTICKQCKIAYNKSPRVKKYMAEWKKRPSSVLIRRAGAYRWNKKYLLLRKYGLTEIQYQEMTLKQDGRCAICSRHKDNLKWKKLVIDHCHQTKKVRGLLCNNCNTAIGMFQDSVEILNSATEYLKCRM